MPFNSFSVVAVLTEKEKKKRKKKKKNPLAKHLRRSATDFYPGARTTDAACRWNHVSVDP